MKSPQGISEAPEMSPDARVRVFRRTIEDLEEFEGLQVDAYLILGERYAFLLDTLLCPEDIAQVLSLCKSEIETKQLICINSHADWDHTWGNGYFSGERSVPILAHEHCRQRMLAAEAHQHLKDYQARYPVFRDVTLVPPSLTFSERLTIVDGDLTIELQHAPGHCSEQIVAWLPDISLLLAFDAVEKPLPAIHDASCAPLMFATLERLAALNAQHLLCSHGGPSSPALIQENLAYLREIERRCRLLLGDRMPSAAELDHTADLIGYPFTEVSAGLEEEIDTAYYSWAHEQNAQAILRWLMAG
jgi:glyoxylase-like metal-dependent hydrolase (beta-lactamase superfamily II)